MKAKPNYDDEELEILQAWEAGWCTQAGQRYASADQGPTIGSSGNLQERSAKSGTTLDVDNNVVEQ